MKSTSSSPRPPLAVAAYPRHARQPRRGVSLLELVAVVTLLGAFAAVAASRSDGTFGDVAARRDAERVGALCHAGRRHAILHGEQAGVRLEKAGGGNAVTRAALVAWRGSYVELGEAMTPSPGVRMNSSHPHLLWDFDGLPPVGDGGAQFFGPKRSFSVWRPGATGALRLSETTP